MAEWEKDFWCMVAGILFGTIIGWAIYHVARYGHSYYGWW